MCMRTCEFHNIIIPNCRHATMKTLPVVLDRIMDGVDGLTSILTE